MEGSAEGDAAADRDSSSGSSVVRKGSWRLGSADCDSSSSINKEGSWRRAARDGSLKGKRDMFKRGKLLSSTTSTTNTSEEEGKRRTATNATASEGPAGRIVESSREEEEEEEEASHAHHMPKPHRIGSVSGRIVPASDVERLLRLKGVRPRAESESTSYYHRSESSGSTTSYHRGKSLDDDDLSSGEKPEISRKESGESVGEDNASALLDDDCPCPSLASREDLQEEEVVISVDETDASSRNLHVEDSSSGGKDPAIESDSSCTRRTCSKDPSPQEKEEEDRPRSSSSEQGTVQDRERSNSVEPVKGEVREYFPIDENRGHSTSAEVVGVESSKEANGASVGEQAPECVVNGRTKSRH